MTGRRRIAEEIVLRNTVYLERAVAHFRAEDGPIDDVFPAYLSPLGW